jgi:hypothetical protein
MSHEERVGILRRHFERKGYRVHSGLQFGCELVLYADDPSKVHSDFCVHLVHPGRVKMVNGCSVFKKIKIHDPSVSFRWPLGLAHHADTDTKHAGFTQDAYTGTHCTK